MIRTWRPDLGLLVEPPPRIEPGTHYELVARLCRTNHESHRVLASLCICASADIRGRSPTYRRTSRDQPSPLSRPRTTNPWSAPGDAAIRWARWGSRCRKPWKYLPVRACIERARNGWATRLVAGCALQPALASIDILARNWICAYGDGIAARSDGGVSRSPHIVPAMPRVRRPCEERERYLR
jgi:hypothetical protein